MTLSKMVDEYLGTYELRGLAESSRMEAKISLAKFQAYIGDPETNIIEQDRIDDFIRRLLKTEKSKYTVNKHIANLAAFFRWMAENGIADSKIQFHKLKTAAPEIRTVRQAEILALLRACPTEIWKCRILLSLCTGLRSQDLDNLKIENLNLEELWIDTKSQKTGKAFAMRPLPTALLPFLRRYFVSISLIARQSGKLLPDRNQRRAWDGICELAGVENVTRHDLRKTFGTLVAAGSYATEAQKLLEHGSIRTTIRHYLSQGEVLRAAVNRLPVEEWVKAAGQSERAENVG